jgi:hypothetical protein
MRKKRHEAATELSFVFVCVGENDLLTVIVAIKLGRMRDS